MLHDFFCSIYHRVFEVTDDPKFRELPLDFLDKVHPNLFQNEYTVSRNKPYEDSFVKFDSHSVKKLAMPMTTKASQQPRHWTLP